MEYWVATQTVLQGGEKAIVGKPKLTDALLRKPPFRFLHDIVSEVTRQTGFAKDLFIGPEFVSANIKDKEAKVSYLTKIINCVGLCLNAHVPARPLKIVAGLEAEQTNIFLQMLAAATTLDGETQHDAVLRTLAGEQMPSSSAKGATDWISRLKILLVSQHASRNSSACPSPTPTLQPTPTADIPAPTPSISPTRKAPSDGPNAAMTPPSSAAAKAANHRAAEVTQQPSQAPGSNTILPKAAKNRYGPGKPACGTGTGSGPGPGPAPGAKDPYADILARKPSGRIKDNSKEQQIRAPPVDEAGAPNVNAKPKTSTPANAISNQSQGIPVPALEEVISACASGSIRSSTAFKNASRELLETKNAAEEACINTPAPTPPSLATSMVSHQERPQSARLGPPKLPASVLPADCRGPTPDRPPSAAAGGKDVKKPNILLDASSDDEESEPLLLPAPSLHEALATSMEGPGKLVRDILEAKREMQGEMSPAEQETGIILGSIVGTEVSRKEEALSKQDEIQKMREAVQMLCQATNPLGKCMDSLQEDAEIMAKEHQHWIKEYQTYSVQRHQERRITEDLLQAEASRITELEEEIRQQRHHIFCVRGQILRNEEKIQGMLGMVSTRVSTR